jgi:hypothetical protein
MELRETPGDGELTALRARVAAMDAEAKASGEARAALEADLGAMKANFALLETAAASERAAAAAALAEANAEREALRTRVAEATIALNARAVQGRVSEIVGALRPDVQAKVLEQLNACTTVEAVNERWATLEGILSAAGVTRVEPAGAGLVHPDPVPERDGARSRPNLTTEQQMQRELLGLR